MKCCWATLRLSLLWLVLLYVEMHQLTHSRGLSCSRQPQTQLTCCQFDFDQKKKIGAQYGVYWRYIPFFCGGCQNQMLTCPYLWEIGRNSNVCECAGSYYSPWWNIFDLFCPSFSPKNAQVNLILMWSSTVFVRHTRRATWLQCKKITLLFRYFWKSFFELQITANNNALVKYFSQ